MAAHELSTSASLFEPESHLLYLAFLVYKRTDPATPWRTLIFTCTVDLQLAQGNQQRCCIFVIVVSLNLEVCSCYLKFS